MQVKTVPRKFAADKFNPSIVHQYLRSSDPVFTASTKFRGLPVDSTVTRRPLSREHVRLVEHFRRQRDHLARRLYARGEYSYGNLAKQVGCSPQLIAKIIQGRC